MSLAPKGRAGVIGRWFVVPEEGGMWHFVDERQWETSTAPIRGERIGNMMLIYDTIINKERRHPIAPRQLLDQGYTLPKKVKTQDERRAK